MCFSANIGLHFFKANNVWRHFCPDFQGFCPDFRKMRMFGGALAPPAPPLPTPLIQIDFDLTPVDFASKRF